MSHTNGIKKFFLNSFYIAVKNLKQLRYQKGTLMMTVVAPTFGFFVMSIALGGSDTDLLVGLYGAPSSIIRSLSIKNASGEINYKSVDLQTKQEMLDKLKSQELKCAVDFSTAHSSKPTLLISGTSFLPNKTCVELVSKVLQASQIRLQAQQQQRRQQETSQTQMVTTKEGEEISLAEAFGVKQKTKSKTAKAEAAASNPETDLPINIVYTNKIGSFSLFELVGPGLTGVTIIFFVFIVSGISFLRERLSGTMERLLISPVSVKQLIFGYGMSFGILGALQVAIFQTFYYKVFKLNSNGDIATIVAFSFCAMMSSLTLGMFVSSFANTEFQVMQIIPTFLVPQIALSGLFDLPKNILDFAKHLPMTYAVTGFKSILLEGATLGDVKRQSIGLLSYTVFFLFCTNLALKRYKPKFVKQGRSKA